MAQLQVILLERVENLGQMGDVVKVKLGYARNFLLPEKKALRATKDNLSYFESRRAQLEAQNLKMKGEAESVAGKMDKARVSIVRQAGESGQLYGSVAARDVADGLTAGGYTVEKRQVVIDRPIKMIGIHNVRVVLHPEVSVTVLVNVAQSEDEAKLQFERFDRGESPVVLTTEMGEEAPAAAAPAPAAPAPAPAAEPAPEAAAKDEKPAKGKAAKGAAAKGEAEASAKAEADKGEQGKKGKKARAEADAEDDGKKGKKDKKAKK
jgi:large subunit ribosomal protein L9